MSGHLYRIVLRLARTKEFPDGSERHGYDIVAPLGSDGRIDQAAWHELRGRCTVRRLWGDEPDEHGVLAHHPGGAGGASWTIDYDTAESDDDEVGFRFADHVFKDGEYVSIRDTEGELNTFKVKAVTKIA